jgi:predicted GNAT family N-acyltransferase
MTVADLAEVSVELADWPGAEAAIAGVRRAVFIEEQGVPEALEWESIDPVCDWFVARQGRTVLGVARLTPDGRIGRMAVLPDWRGRGVGAALLGAALDQARKRGFGGVALSAQIRAMPFYARFGFVAEGPEYWDAGIPHRKMRLNW